MAYDALTIDTQTVYANGARLDSGLIAQLDQYKDGLVQVVLSEIVCREINSMLLGRANETVNSLLKGMKKGSTNHQLSDEQRLTLESLLSAISTPEDHAKNQLKAFVASTGALIVSAEDAPMKSVLDAYFSKAPPFSGKGKKAEFPDAIAILSIEAWAKERGKKVLAVSNDGDWKEFAAQSCWIDCVEDLGKAMSMLTDAAEKARADAEAVLTNLANGSAVSSKKVLDDELSLSIEFETPYVEFSSSMHAEDEGASISLIEYTWPDIVSEEIDIVRVRSNGFVMRVPVDIKVQANADISFFSYDSIDKDYMSLGSTSVEREIEFRAFALIECELNSDDANGKSQSLEYGIKGAQVVGVPTSIDLGHVEPSYEHDEFISDFSSSQE